jgi:protein phosphatase
VLRQGELHLLTRDHTFAQSLADDGIISQAEVPHHRMRNMLLRSLGGESAQADVQHLALESGDQLLVCTDGLTEMVSEPVIKHWLQTAPSPEVACDRLIEGALSAGGRDNVTVIVARFAW